MKNLLALLIFAAVTLPASAQTIRKGSDGSVTVFHKDGTSDGLAKKFGATDGKNACTGCVGEVVSVSSSGPAAITSGQYTDGGNAGLNLKPGRWRISGSYLVTVGTMSALVNVLWGIGTSPGNSGDGLTTALPITYIQERPASHTPTGNLVRMFDGVTVNISTPTTYYPKMFIAATVGTATSTHHIQAIRVP